MWSKWVKCPTLLCGAAPTRRLCTVMMGAREASSSSLYRRLSALGSMADGTAAKRVLDEWVSEGKPVKFYNVKGYVRELRKFRNYNLALQVLSSSNLHFFLLPSFFCFTGIAPHFLGKYLFSLLLFMSMPISPLVGATHEIQTALIEMNLH